MMARRIPGTQITECPNCGAPVGEGRRGVQYHSLSIWCLACGWNAARDTTGHPCSPDSPLARQGQC